MNDLNTQKLNSIFDSFKIKATCVSYKKNRNVALYDLKLSPGIRVKQIEKFKVELGLILKSKTNPIIKPMTDQGLVRLEIVEDHPSKVDFFKNVGLKPNDLTLPIFLGETVEGKNLWMDMVKNPHLLIAGTTGSGKSNILHGLIGNGLINNCKLFLVDTKNIEFNSYNGLNDIEVADTYANALSQLNCLIEIMEYRYSYIKDNKLSSNFFISPKCNFPPIMFIVDEFADLIMQDEEKLLYKNICKLSQKCRAAGIYCTLATQRPSVDVLSGLIKSNFPARVALKVASGADSRIILDCLGAENLAGCGDAILKNYNNDFCRFQAAYVSSESIVDLAANQA